MISDLLAVDLEKELGLGNLPVEEKQKIADDMTELASNRLNLRLLSLLSDEEVKELDALMANNGDLPAFFKSKVANLDIVVAEIIAELKQEVLSLHEAVKAGTTNA